MALPKSRARNNGRGGSRAPSGAETPDQTQPNIGAVSYSRGVGKPVKNPPKLPGGVSPNELQRTFKVMNGAPGGMGAMKPGAYPSRKTPMGKGSAKPRTTSGRGVY